MLNKLKALREEREEGFTLIELLVVILIIGILAAIAIPVFLNQRQTANDGAVESDVKNAATQVESWLVGERGKATKIDSTNLAKVVGDVKKSSGVHLAIKGDANAYCIIGGHENGKNYITADDTALTGTALTGNVKVLTYDNASGGLNAGGGAGAALSGTCASATNGTWITIP